MSFPSVLFAGASGPSAPPTAADADCLVDLNLDQIIAGVTAGRERFQLRSDLTCALVDEAVIADRQQVCQDIEGADVAAGLNRFAAAMAAVRRDLAQADALRHRYQIARWQVTAAIEYRDAVVGLHSVLTAADLRSRGLRAIREMLDGLLDGAGFRSLRTDLDLVAPALAAVRYDLLVTGSQVQVRRGGGRPDYANAIDATFRRFRQGEVQNHLVGFTEHPAMNHVESGVLDLVAEVYPEVFAELDRFVTRHPHLVDDEVAAFDRDVQFFLGYLDYIAPLIRADLPFCFPTFDRPSGSRDRTVEIVDTFDLALAATLRRAGSPAPVRNDITVSGSERILLITGPNNGGKTTLARTFGQVHHLARLGLPVPGRSARVLLCDNVFTHFARPERPGAALGGLQDELVRMHDILGRAGRDSVVILNELFTSTTLADAILLGGRVMRSLIEKDLVAVYVTFVDELADCGDTIVTMVATVPDDDPTARTYRIVRRPADSTAHAHALAVRHRLTYRQLTDRIAS